MNSVEFAVRDGVPYAIDFMNPAPDMDVNSLTPHVLRVGGAAMADMAVRLATRRSDGGAGDRRELALGADVRRRGRPPTVRRSAVTSERMTSAGDADPRLPRPARWLDRRCAARTTHERCSTSSSGAARGLVFGDRPLCTVLRPRFFTAGAVPRCSRSACTGL